ncbi:tetratricopeptide repeat protein [Streptomyces sp. Je 1-79]|uniref:tetratricopeptide repeat protein n=1 Tax=Streptomyces sp. Je 1-79 TaxID=2943847 RepID=UPI0021A66B47|nr:tetratricopeptide repeat protein [Streptomyces sp. Je 1-79]MCT4352748.1 tetratricopeptide repeat protein [Streptomyces sp. Je 1-79]
MSPTLDRADALFDVGRYEQAAALAAQHLATVPQDAAALVLLARCRHRLGREQEALESVEAALLAEPDSLPAWLMRTHILLALKSYEEAERSARHSVELAPGYWGSHYALGTVLDRSVRTERRREAYDAARTAVGLAPEESDAHFLVGLTAQRNGDHRVARQAYETALRLDPESSEAHNNLSLLHLRGRWLRPGAWTKAAEGFVESAALDMNDRQARYNLETMAWGTAAGARWVALLGFVAASIGSAPLRTGSSGAEAAVPYVIGALVLVAGWAGWAVWITRRVPPRLRRPLLLVARNCRPVLAMAVAVGLLGLHSAASLALWTLDESVLGVLGFPLFWTVIITYWVSRAALQRRAPRPERGR